MDPEDVYFVTIPIDPEDVLSEGYSIGYIKKHSDANFIVGVGLKNAVIFPNKRAAVTFICQNRIQNAKIQKADLSKVK
jgi:hypothetical protein